MPRRTSLAPILANQSSGPLFTESWRVKEFISLVRGASQGGKISSSGGRDRRAACPLSLRGTVNVVGETRVRVPWDPWEGLDFFFLLGRAGVGQKHQHKRTDCSSD